MRAFTCEEFRFGVTFRGCNLFVSFLTLIRYPSMFGEAVGGVQELFFLKGWGFEAGLFEVDCFCQTCREIPTLELVVGPHLVQKSSLMKEHLTVGGLGFWMKGW